MVTAFVTQMNELRRITHQRLASGFEFTTAFTIRIYQLHFNFYATFDHAAYSVEV